jgi:hypothetical protein
MEIVVKLSSWEMLLAAQAGVMRQVENIQKERQTTYGAGGNEWQLHVEGCLGEYALAKYLGIHWPGKGKLRAFDVGEFDVRTRSQENYELILHPEDPDNRIFWLLCGRNGLYKVKGWILGSEGKRREYWKDPAGGRPAYFVPQSALNAPLDIKLEFA